ncbi:DUF1738 domain-containing protein [Brucella intermedia]|uniref:ArdC family protein n=1 Tax=Brucella TaxID=234 RepID=UPI0009468801|nr:zincin-like metallopeptidase domain-containing protein [Brucella intermedia]
MSMKNEQKRTDIHAQITDRIIADLKKGVRSWVQPWATGDGTNGVIRPLRHNGEPYSGMNVILLWSEAVARGYTAPTWMTLRQANDLGGRIRKGENGTVVVYASRFTKTAINASGEEFERDIPFLKTYRVFNVEQIEGLPASYCSPSPATEPSVTATENAFRFFAEIRADIRHGGSQAYYCPSSDHIQMPVSSDFKDIVSYLSVLGHETIHWTAHPDRVGRDLSRYAKDRSERAREELIAEIGAALLCADLGLVPELEPRPDHASYLASWLTVLSNDKRAIFQAAAHAQRAVNFLHDLQPRTEPIRGAA